MNSLLKVCGCISVLAAMVLTLGISPAMGNGNGIQCGAVLKKGKHKLYSNLVYCNTPGAAITLLKGAVLDLNGFTVNGCQIACQVGCTMGETTEPVEEAEGQEAEAQFVSSNEGIVLRGWAVLLNGFVREFTIGVVLMGPSNTVKNVDSSANSEDGFVITSDSRQNKLLHNNASANCEDGFEIWGIRNVFTKTSARDNGEHGYEVNGDLNEFNWDTAERSSRDNFKFNSSLNTALGIKSEDTCSDDGIEIDGNSNILKLCHSNNNSVDGIVIDGGNNTIQECSLTENGGDGAEIDGPDNRILLNYIGRNARDGVNLQGGMTATNTEVSGNVVEGNGADILGDHGITIGLGATMNTVIENSVFGTIGGFDLRDENPDATVIYGSLTILTLRLWGIQSKRTVPV